MSLMSMRQKMTSKQTANTILWALIGVFLVSVFFWGLPTTARGRLSKARQYADMPGGTTEIATVNGEPVFGGELDKEFYRLGDQQQQMSGQSFDLNSAQGARSQAFDNIVRQIITEKEARTLHAKTSGFFGSFALRGYAKQVAELSIASMRKQAKDMHKMAADSAAKDPKNKTKIMSEEDYFQQTLSMTGQQRLGLTGTVTENAYESAFIKKLLSDQEDGMYDELLTYANNRAIGAAQAKTLKLPSYTTDDFVKHLYANDVKASWILITASENTDAKVKEAYAKATKLHDQLAKDTASFGKVAKAESADYMTKEKNGSLDWMTPDENHTDAMAVAEYLAYATKKSEISSVFLVNQYGQLGYAFVLVEDTRKAEKAKDFNWKKDGRLAKMQVAQRYESAIGNAYIYLKKAQAKIVRNSNELKYYDAQKQNKTDEMNSLMQVLQNDGKLPPVVRASFKYQASLTEKDPMVRATMLDEVYSFANRTEIPKILLQVADLYFQQGKKDLALERVNNAALSASTEEMDPDRTLHKQLQDEFTKLGDNAKAAEMAKWIVDHPKKADTGMNPNMLNFSR